MHSSVGFYFSFAFKYNFFVCQVHFFLDDFNVFISEFVQTFLQEDTPCYHIVLVIVRSVDKVLGSFGGTRNLMRNDKHIGPRVRTRSVAQQGEITN